MTRCKECGGPWGTTPPYHSQAECDFRLRFLWEKAAACEKARAEKAEAEVEQKTRAQLRLRKWADDAELHYFGAEAKVKRLREALERIAKCKDNPDPMGYLPAIAAEALAAKEAPGGTRYSPSPGLPDLGGADEGVTQIIGTVDRSVKEADDGKAPA